MAEDPGHIIARMLEKTIRPQPDIGVEGGDGDEVKGLHQAKALISALGKFKPTPPALAEARGRTARNRKLQTKKKETREEASQRAEEKAKRKERK